MTQHTRTPWYCELDKGIEGHWTIWADVEGVKTFIADCYEGPEDASHIVRAVNCFDDMLAALKEMLVFTANEFPNRAIAMAEAAVAKAS